MGGSSFSQGGGPGGGLPLLLLRQKNTPGPPKPAPGRRKSPPGPHHQQNYDPPTSIQGITAGIREMSVFICLFLSIWSGRDVQSDRCPHRLLRAKLHALVQRRLVVARRHRSSSPGPWLLRSVHMSGPCHPRGPSTSKEQKYTLGR